MTRRIVAPDIHRPDLGKPHGFEGEFTEEAFTFRAVTGSPHLLQEPALCQSILTVTGMVPPGMRIVGVSVNGAPRGFGHITETSVCVWPLIPLQWDTVRVDCEGPTKAIPMRAYDLSKAVTARPSHLSSLNDSYGLQAPQIPKYIGTP